MRTFFDKIDTAEKAYWLGFITADGNTSLNGYTTSLNLAAKDKEHLEKLARLIDGSVKNIVWRKGENSYPGCYLHVSDSHMHSSLVSLGVVPNKTAHNQDVIMSAVPKDFLSHFVRGIFDGDGSISWSNVGDKLIVNTTFCGEEKLMVAVRDEIHKTVGVSKVKPTMVNGLTIIRWGGKRQAKAIADWMYQSDAVRLERKYHRFQELNKMTSKGKFFGVTIGASGKWNASIINDGKRVHIGNFASAEEAAMAHDAYAVKIGKPKYKLNFPERL